MLKRSLLYLFFVQAGLVQAQWTTVISNPEMRFRQVVFPDDLHGYIIGERASTTGSFVLKTVDGGLSWDTISFAVPYISYIQMLNADKGYLFKSGSPNEIVYTEDGFSTMDNPPGILDSSFTIVSVGLINDSTGYHLLNEGRLHKFHNYGASFTVVRHDVFFMDFPATTTGYMATSDLLLKTINSGLTWDTVSTNIPPYSYLGKFVSTTQGYVMSMDISSTATTFYRTIDGGLSFSIVNNMNAQNFAARGNYCMLIDNDGNVELSHNSGDTWVAETTGMDPTDIYSGAITPSGKAWLVGQFSGKLMTRSGTLSVSESQTAGFNVYPNPARQTVNIQMNNSDGLTTCTLRNQLGQNISTENFNGTTHQVNVNNMAPGIYFLTLSNTLHTGTTRLVIEK